MKLNGNSHNWELLWREYQRGALTDSDLVSAVIAVLDDAEPNTVIQTLPTGYRELLQQFVMSGKVPMGMYYFDATSREESQRLHKEVFEFNRQVIDAIKRFFEA